MSNVMSTFTLRCPAKIEATEATIRVAFCRMVLHCPSRPCPPQGWTKAPPKHRSASRGPEATTGNAFIECVLGFVSDLPKQKLARQRETSLDIFNIVLRIFTYLLHICRRKGSQRANVLHTVDSLESRV